ncbi:TetR/AcrR family transcriptional regulator [Xinfangfangia sp. D13-10-4-6]|uniref:TetR/AcrR family transcriptional regulator n=1 Tax=Pseudogemmobacter hezensis TaxID=2737662 RepID=UPI001555430E|nr:TetR/AcrR family transcriptional regulator [Pseudogemmobacter hezensis]NPD13943.1 TetR/AcrR family transcriptional regulator [Pseudogemmobacter hezensis]
MESTEIQETGWRGSPEIWLNAACQALTEGGIDQVRILPLATRLGLARTSFYWHFKDRQSLLDALADRWESRTTQPLVSACAAYAASEAEAHLNVISVFLDGQVFDDAMEFAVRGWALQDAGITARIHQADRLRLAALSEMLIRWGHAPGEADVRARAIYLTQIGYISMQVRETLDERMRRVPDYVAIFSGAGRPGPDELARFHARHGYLPG